MRIGRGRPLERVGDHEGLRHQAARIFEQEFAGALLVFGVHLLGVGVHVVVPVRHALQALRELPDVLVEVRNDEAAGTAVDRDIEADLLDGSHDQNEVVEVGDREQGVGTGGLHLVDQRARVGEPCRIRLEHHDLDALSQRQFLQPVGGRRTERGILEDNGNLRLIADELGHLQLRPCELRGARKRREGVGPALVELIRTRAGDQRHLGAFRHFAGDQRQSAGEAAVDRGQFVSGNQPVRLCTRHRGVALHIREDQIELGAAERFDAAGFVDHLDGEFRGGDAADADLRHASGSRVERADIDGIGGPAAQRNGAEGAGGEYATRLDKKLTAALPLGEGMTPVRIINDRRLTIFFHVASPGAIKARTYVRSLVIWSNRRS